MSTTERRALVTGVGALALIGLAGQAPAQAAPPTKKPKKKSPNPKSKKVAGGPGRATGPSGESLSIDGLTGRTAGITAPDSTDVTAADTTLRLAGFSAGEEQMVSASLAATTPTPARSPWMPRVPLTADLDWHLARRAAHAPTTALIYQMRQVGRAAWLERQLAPATISDRVCDSILAKIPAASASAYDIINKHYGYDTGWKTGHLVVRAAMIRKLFSERYLLESMVEFWHDLLHVTALSDKGAYWMSDYDTFVIRKNAMGKFTTMLWQATTHGAMLDYLDNSESSKVAPNENLGREFLELHTLGVGNFTEADVKQMTLLLTGWYGNWTTMKGTFDPSRHYVGPVNVAGLTHANSTAEGGPAALSSIVVRMARHPKTARRICERLAVRFVSDVPPAALVDRLVQLYLANDTAIVPVLRELFTSPEFETSIGQKWRRPQEAWATAVRAGKPTMAVLDPVASANEPWSILGTEAWLLDMAGHLPLNWPAPNGYPDSGDRWLHTNGLLASWNRAESTVGNWEPQYTMTPWDTVFTISPTMTPMTVVKRVFRAVTGFGPDNNTTDLLTRFLWSGSVTGPMPPSSTDPVGADRLSWWLHELVRMTMASPHFQIR